MRLSKIALVIGILTTVVGLSLQAPVITFCTIYDEH